MSMCGCLLRAPPTGDLVPNRGVCLDWELNQRPFGLQAGTQSTEPPQLGLHLFFKKSSTEFTVFFLVKRKSFIEI